MANSTVWLAIDSGTIAKYACTAGRIWLMSPMSVDPMRSLGAGSITARPTAAMLRAITSAIVPFGTVLS